MAARPNSLAGSMTVAAAKRTVAAWFSRPSSSASAMTAGCAGTTAGVNRSTADVLNSQPWGTHQNAGLLIERA